MPKSIETYEMRNIEFWTEGSTLTDVVIFVKFISQQVIVRFEDLTDNQVNILYLKLLDYSGLLKECILPTDDRRQVLKKFVIRHWGLADQIPDIDDKGNFNFEQVDIDRVVADLAYSISFWIMEMLRRKFTAEAEVNSIQERIDQLMQEKDMIKSINLKYAV